MIVVGVHHLDHILKDDGARSEMKNKHERERERKGQTRDLEKNVGPGQEKVGEGKKGRRRERKTFTPKPLTHN